MRGQSKNTENRQIYVLLLLLKIVINILSFKLLKNDEKISSAK